MSCNSNPTHGFSVSTNGHSYDRSLRLLDQVRNVIRCKHYSIRLDGAKWLMGQVLYGAGLRMMECVRFRVKDIDFAERNTDTHNKRLTPRVCSDRLAMAMMDESVLIDPVPMATLIIKPAIKDTNCVMPDLIRHPEPAWIPASAGMTNIGLFN